MYGDVFALPSKPVALADVKDTTEVASMSDRDPLLRLASQLLPEDEREAIWSIYSWCRRADEICDSPTPPRTSAERCQLLEGISLDLKQLSNGGAASNDIDAGLQNAMRRWPGLESEPFRDMLEGMKQELQQERFTNFDPELKRYAYCVAGTVGLMVLPVLGAPNPIPSKVRDRAVDLGIAIQLVNILRDVGEDAERGRIYIPLEDLQRFGVDESEILQRRVPPSPQYQSLVNFEVQRTRELLQSARSGIGSLPARSQLVVLAVIRFMEALLHEVLDRGCDNISAKVKLGTFGKVSCLVAALADWVRLLLTPSSLSQ